MRTRLLKAATLVVAVGFLVGATIAAGQAQPKNAKAKQTEAKPDAGEKPATPTFLPATKAAMPMHFDEAPKPAEAKPAPKQAPQQAAPTQQATP
jgi:hypothetical protein